MASVIVNRKLLIAVESVARRPGIPTMEKRRRHNRLTTALFLTRRFLRINSAR
jgi:hypothetical protein